jgi:hypothetical protein
MRSDVMLLVAAQVFTMIVGIGLSHAAAIYFVSLLRDTNYDDLPFDEGDEEENI